MSEKLEDLCINKKTKKAVFQIQVFVKGLPYAPVCKWTRFRIKPGQKSVDIGNKIFDENKTCKYCRFMRDMLYHCADTGNYYLGCGFFKHKISDIANEDWEGF